MRIRFLGILSLILLSGCIVDKGVVHTVGKGEDFWAICRRYRADPGEVAAINHIKDPSILTPGEKIFIPNAKELRKVKVHHAEPPQPAPKDNDHSVVIQKDGFLWPVKGRVISLFGMRGGVKHDGIDIKAPEGASVRAAAAGIVVFVSSAMKGYGKIIIIKHSEGLYTVYAHNENNLVEKGQKVSKGAIIATVGKTGNAETYHLHFEVRQGKVAKNPLFFLP